MLEERKIETRDGRTLIVREQTMRVLRPLINGEDPEEAGDRLMGIAVHDEQGNALGDAVLDLGAKDYQAVMAVVNEVHGFSEPPGTEDETGNAG